MELPKTLRFILLFIFNFWSIIAQPEIDWTQTYGGNNWDEARAVQQTSDGGIIITCSTDFFGSGNDDVYLIGVDGNGNLLWEKTFGLAQADAASSIVEISDGGFAFAGVLTRKMVLLK